MSIVAFAAWPMALGGWLMWGEGWWILDIGPNIAIGLALYGALRLLAGTACDRVRTRRE
ncbi:hypothetical protein [Lacipirellula sp.]|uniref:hypothetical protein n=1 Tax=Lacipirellula sp. TaxID=2691419 RepID=UPI003D0E3EBD